MPLYDKASMIQPSIGHKMHKDFGTYNLDRLVVKDHHTYIEALKKENIFKDLNFSLLQNAYNDAYYSVIGQVNLNTKNDSLLKFDKDNKALQKTLEDFRKVREEYFEKNQDAAEAVFRAPPEVMRQMMRGLSGTRYNPSMEETTTINLSMKAPY